MNADFDALASLYAAKKLYPDAEVILSDKLETKVRQFMNMYRDILPFKLGTDIDWTEVTEVVIVDVASLRRVGKFTEELDLRKVKITVFDHHPAHEDDVKADEAYVEAVGANVTLLIEKIREQNIDISWTEATLFGLGIYTDTNYFTNDTTTARDFQAASFLMEKGMRIELVEQYAEYTLLGEQQEILNDLFGAMETYRQDGLEIVVASSDYDTYVGGLANIVSRMIEVTNADAVIAVVGMKNHVYIVGRASSERVNLLPLLTRFKGGGHEKAGSATVKREDVDVVLPLVIEHLPDIYQDGIVARDFMSTPVKTIPDDISIEEAGERMYRYGHSGYPVMHDGKLVGIITRRDLDKAIHHGLGHAPVKAYMTVELITIKPETPLEEIQQIILQHNIGRLPVMQDEKILGIVTRTNIIRKLNELLHRDEEEKIIHTNVAAMLKSELTKDAYYILEQIKDAARKIEGNVYLIGGIVRDLFLHVDNDDIDIVVEGSGIDFAKLLQSEYGGEVIVHESFGTATWVTEDGAQIDVTTSRFEYYDRPASLPDVELSNIDEDLERRDFTINAMAVCLSEGRFGELIDPFNGQQDLYDGKLRVLHNISFVEDPTRILRGIRFEARFGFEMGQETFKFALQSIDKVKNLSMNRIIEDLKRIFHEENVVRAMERLYDVQFWKQFGVSDKTKESTLIQTKNLVETFNKYEHADPNWFYFVTLPFYDTGFDPQLKPFALTKKEMKFVEQVNEISQIQDLENQEKLGDIHARLKPFEDDIVLFELAMRKKANEVEIIRYLDGRKQLEPFLTGADLILYGLKPGKDFKQILFELEIAAFNGEIESKEMAYQWLEKRIEN